MTKQLRKVIMKRSKLRNDFLKIEMMLPKVFTENNTTYSNPFAKSQKTVFLEFRTKTYNQ